MAQVTFKSNLGAVLRATDRQLAMAAEIIGGKAESHAKEEITRAVYDTPESPNYVRTGNLRNSITHTTEDNGHTVVIGSAVEYALYVELGTSRGMSPRPYLRPAIENLEPAWAIKSLQICK